MVANDFRSHGTILAIFDLQVTQILRTKFQVNLPLGSREEAQTRFAFPIEMILANFDLEVAPILPTKFQVNLLFA